MVEQHIGVKLQRGNHACNIFRNRQERLSIILPFFKGALANNERCLFIVEESLRITICQILQNAGFRLETGLKRGQPVFFTPENSYIKNRCFDPDRTIEFILQAQNQAIVDGYNGLRINGTGTDFSGSGLSGCDRLIEYESKINYFFPPNYTTAICQYDETLAPEELLRDILLVHPQLVIGEQVLNNPYYQSPQEFGRSPKQNYQTLKNNLIEEGERA